MHWFFLYSFVAIWKRIEACIIDANPGEISARTVRLARKSKTLTKNGRWLVAFRFLDGAFHLHGLLSVLSLVLVAHLIYCSIMRSATPHSVRTLLSHSLSTLSSVPLLLFCWGVCRLSRIGNQINKAHANSRKWLHESSTGINSRWASGLAWALGSLGRKCLYIKYARANKKLSTSIDKLKVSLHIKYVSLSMCVSVCVRLGMPVDHKRHSNRVAESERGGNNNCIENNNKCNFNAKRVCHLAKRQVLPKIFAVSLWFYGNS